MRAMTHRLLNALPHLPRAAAIILLVVAAAFLAYLLMARSPVVGIVAGHGGLDSGATCEDGLREVDITQQVAQLVSEQLRDAGYQVDVLAEFDNRLTGYRAAALISLHVDSCLPEFTGFKIAATSRGPATSEELAECLWKRYESITHLPRDRTHITEDMMEYHVFREVNMDTPAVIIELGYLEADREILVKHPELAARGISNGIRCYLER